MTDTRSASTESRHSGLIPWKPGQSGNPAGRKPGSRNKLGEHFLHALQQDFEANGPSTIVAARNKDPVGYLKIIASLLPKEFQLKDASTDGLSDEEIGELILALRAEKAKIKALAQPIDPDAKPN